MTENSIDSSADELRIDSAIADYLDAVQAGEVLDEHAFLEEHADIADALQAFFADRRRLSEMAGALGPASNHVLGREMLMPAPGTTLKYFGDYLLLEEIARGGMGVIYKARQTKLNRIVAVKLILAGQLAAKDTIDRFYVEAKSAARLTHPNIVAIHEVGQHEDQHYFSMDYVEGDSLAELIRNQPLPVWKSVECVRIVAEAIQYAHVCGVLHRDLKPSNILIDLSSQPRITDFGLAKHVTDDQSLTATGQILGTPSYMPPEQALGNQAAMGPASDVYSMGAVLYELLTGRPPFLAATALETILQARQREVISPSMLNPGVSRDLETICLKCLEKDPKKRYETAGALADDLCRFENHEPIKARPISVSERGVRWCRRNPAITALLATISALLAVMVVAFVGVLSQWIRAENFRRLEQRAKNHAIRAERTAAQNAIDAQVARRQAIMHAESAREQAEAAEAAREREARNLYISHMNLAMQAVDEGNFRRAASLLRNYEQDIQHGDPHGFEWFHLWRRVNLAGDATFDHGGRLYSVEFVSGGLVTAGNDKTIKVWDLQTGLQRLTLKGHEASVTSAVVSPDGKLLCSSGMDDTIRFWNLEDGKLETTIQAHEGGIRQVAFSPDGQMIASAGLDRTLRLFDVKQANETATFTGHEGLVYAVAFSRDGKTLISSSVDATIRFWNVASGETIHVINKPRRQRAYAIAVSGDGKTMATGSSDDRGLVELWDVESGQSIAQLKGHTDNVTSVAFSPDDKTMASGSEDQTVRRWKVDTGEQIAVYQGHAGAVRSVKFLADGTRLASCAFDGTAKLWRLDQDERQQDLVQLDDKGILSLTWSPDGQTVAATRWGLGLHLIDAQSGKLRKTLEGLTASAFRTVFLRDGELLASAGRDKTVRLWRVETGEFVHTLGEHDHDIRGLAWSAERGVLASADAAGLIKLWDIEKRETTQSHQCLDDKGQPFGVQDIAFSPDGETLAVIARHVTLITLATGETIRVGRRVDAGASIAYSPNGQFVTANREESAQVWTAKGRRLAALRGHADLINGVCFSPDGKNIATASADHTVKLWDVDTGEQLGTLRGHADAATCLAFSPDGKTLVSGGYDGAVHFWRAASEDAVFARISPPTRQDTVFNYSNTTVARALDEIKRLGGRVVRDQDLPDHPVIQIHLTGSEFDDDTLALLSHFPELQLLSVFNTNATGIGLENLKNCLQLKQLTLMGNAVNDDGVAMLKHFPTLTHLSLGMGIQPRRLGTDGQPLSRTYDPITDAALVHLSGLVSLEYLAFDNTQISNHGIRHLAGLTNLNQLQFFRTPDVNEEGLSELRRALPNCEMGSYDQAQENEPHFAATLIIHAGKEGVDSPSCRVGIGRLGDNSAVRKGESKCGPVKSLSTLTWNFKRHEAGVDVYDIQWTLSSDGKTIKVKSFEARFNGARTVLISDEHFIVLERRALKRSESTVD